MVALLKLFLAFVGSVILSMGVMGTVVLLHAPRARAVRLLITATVHGAVLTLALVLWFNARPGFFGDNQLAFDLTSELRQLGGMPDPLRDQGVGFVLIDNSANKTTVAPHDATEAGQQQVAITDRALLADVLSFLGEHHEKIGLVVCDIVFEDSSAHDRDLFNAIRPLAGHDKIVLAQGGKENTPLLQFGERVMGRATERLQGKLIAAHTIYLNGSRSIPCLMYERTTGARLLPMLGGLLLCEQDGPHSGTAYSAFPAALDRFDERSTRLSNEHGGEGHTAVPAYLPLPLGYAASPAGLEDLLAKVEEQIAGARYLPVVMIGEFSAPLGEHAGSDVHHTFHGSMQGSTILLELYLEMLGGAHTVPWIGIVFVWLLLTTLSLQVFARPWNRDPWQVFRTRFWRSGELVPVAPASSRRLRVDATGVAGARMALWHSLRDHLKKKMQEVVPIAFFLVVFVLIDWIGHIRMNLAAFVVYFLLLDALFKKLDLRASK